MNFTEKITKTYYAVKHIDLREPKPRTPHEQVGGDNSVRTGIVDDLIASIQFFADRRKGRNRPVKYSKPYISLYYTPEGCVIGNLTPEVRKAAEGAFRALPYEVKHRLAFFPNVGELDDREQLWRETLRPAMPQGQYEAAMDAILRKYTRIKDGRRTMPAQN